MKISLMVLSAGASAGKMLPVNAAQFIIGRDPQCNLRPASAMISKRHCAVYAKENKVYVRDFESTNGTFVNEAQISGEVEIKDGDTLKVGPLSFKVVVEAAPAVNKPTPTPPPKPKAAAPLDDEDAAAALLSVDSGEVDIPSGDSVEAEIPGGSTIMEMPAFAPAEEAAKTEAATQEKPAAAKPEAKKKNEVGSAQNAAKDLLARLRTGKRK